MTDRFDLIDLDLYTEALSCERLRLPAHKGYGPEFYPLIILAKMEAQLLYPGRRVVIVELNSLLGPGSNIFQFAEWFAATRVEDISNADPKVRGFVSTPKAPGVEGKRHRGLAIQYEISHYRRMLREVLQSSLGYQPPDLEGFDYHNLAFDPRHLLKSRSIDTLQLMIQGFSDSRRLWESINSCVKGLGGASLTGDTGPVSDQGKPLRLLGLGVCNHPDT